MISIQLTEDEWARVALGLRIAAQHMHTTDATLAQAITDIKGKVLKQAMQGAVRREQLAILNRESA